MGSMMNPDDVQRLERDDLLAPLRDEFHIPQGADGQPQAYLVGHSLGLQPRRTAEYVGEALRQWRELGVRGHFEGPYPWLPYHEFLTEPMAQLVGAMPDEVVMMNSLTVNLHLMLATFYRPAGIRNQVMIEHGAFPSDRYAVASHLQWRGQDPQQAIVWAPTITDSLLIDHDRLCETIESAGDRLAVILLPGVQYATGQALDMARIVDAAQRNDIIVGFDLAHAAGNLELQLHQWNVDFAVWCSYKYLNSGPGSVGGCFIHQRHAQNIELPRLAGWWGHDKDSRFNMPHQFAPIATAEGWQLSNPPILSLAAIRASLDVFSQAGGMRPLRTKSRQLTGLLAQRLEQRLGDRIQMLTPSDSEARGCQLSLRVVNRGQSVEQLEHQLRDAGVIVDTRRPDILRLAPAPLYNSFADVERFVDTLEACLMPGQHRQH